MAKEQRPRITIDVDEDLYSDVYRVFPWGTRNQILREVLRQVTDAVEKGGMGLAYAIVSGKIMLFGASEGKEERPGG